jgi:hypothetical protein
LLQFFQSWRKVLFILELSKGSRHTETFSPALIARCSPSGLQLMPLFVTRVGNRTFKVPTCLMQDDRILSIRSYPGLDFACSLSRPQFLLLGADTHMSSTKNASNLKPLPYIRVHVFFLFAARPLRFILSYGNRESGVGSRPARELFTRHFRRLGFRVRSLPET